MRIVKATLAATLVFAIIALVQQTAPAGQNGKSKKGCHGFVHCDKAAPCKPVCGTKKVKHKVYKCECKTKCILGRPYYFRDFVRGCNDFFWGCESCKGKAESKGKKKGCDTSRVCRSRAKKHLLMKSESGKGIAITKCGEGKSKGKGKDCGCGQKSKSGHSVLRWVR